MARPPLRTYPEASWITFHTDQNPLRSVLNITDATEDLEVGGLRLSKLVIYLMYRARVQHQAAVALSRLPTTRHDDALLNNDVPFVTIPTVLRQATDRWF